MKEYPTFPPRTRLAGAALACWFAAAVAAQEEITDYPARFGRFDSETRNSIIRGLERKIQLDPNPAIQRIVSLQRDAARLPVAGPLPYHRAEDWAPRVAAKRRLIPEDDPRHQEVRRRYPARDIMPDLIRGVFYDWGTGEIVRRKEPLTDLEVMANLLNGYPPGSDIAFAQLLQKFDNLPKMRKLSSYLAHQYADLDGNVFTGVTLYEAWYSGETIAVPDVDAIPFAEKILKRRFRSPIPADSRRDALFRSIRDEAFAYRKYRTLREAAAAAFVRAAPDMDPNYVELVPRFHYLLATLGDDPARLARYLEDKPDRDKMIGAIDRTLEKSVKEYDKRLLHEKHLADMQAWVTYWARLAIYEQHKAEPGKL